MRKMIIIDCNSICPKRNRYLYSFSAGYGEKKTSPIFVSTNIDLNSIRT